MTGHRGRRARGGVPGCALRLAFAAACVLVVYALYFGIVYSTVTP